METTMLEKAILVLGNIVGFALTIILGVAGVVAGWRGMKKLLSPAPPNKKKPEKTVLGFTKLEDR